MLVLINFFFCHHVFKKPSAAEASESVYMWERVKAERPLGITSQSSIPLFIHLSVGHNFFSVWIFFPTCNSIFCGQALWTNTRSMSIFSVMSFFPFFFCLAYFSFIWYEPMLACDVLVWCLAYYSKFDLLA